jgi:hypothetical protein
MTGDGVASYGHKLGQAVGVLLQNVLKQPLAAFAKANHLYLDSQEPRPGLRSGRKVTWTDNDGNPHDLDYVLEKAGTPDKQGAPVAFIESAWRRYTKHSRNKSGELEGALLPLRERYPSTRFLGVIVAGEYSAGGLAQLRSRGIEVLAISFETIEKVFAKNGLSVSYAEKAGPAEKEALARKIDALNKDALAKLTDDLWKAIEAEYAGFEDKLKTAVTMLPKRVAILALWGVERVFDSVAEAVRALEGEGVSNEDAAEAGFEVFVEYEGGARSSGRFKTRDETLWYLKQIG